MKNIISNIILSIILTLTFKTAILALAQENREVITVDNAVEIAQIAVLEGHTDDVNTLSFSPDGELLASGSSDTDIRLWKVSENEEVGLLDGHESPVYSLGFSSDGTMLISLSYSLSEDADNSTRTWNVKTGEQTEILNVFGFNFGFNRMGFDANQGLVAGPKCTGMITFSNSGIFCDVIHIDLIDINTGNTALTFEDLFQGDAWSIAFNPDGTMLAVGSNDGTMNLFETESGTRLAQWQSDGYRVFGVAFSPDGKLVAISVGDGSVILFGVEELAELATLSGHTDPMIAVAFSPDGTLLASGSVDKTVQLWNVESHEELTTLEGHSDIVTSIAFSPDGTLLASGGYDDTIRLWGIAE